MGRVGDDDAFGVRRLLLRVIDTVALPLALGTQTFCARTLMPSSPGILPIPFVGTFNQKHLSTFTMEEVPIGLSAY